MPTLVLTWHALLLATSKPAAEYVGKEKPDSANMQALFISRVFWFDRFIRLGATVRTALKWCEIVVDSTADDCVIIAEQRVKSKF